MTGTPIAKLNEFEITIGSQLFKCKITYKALMRIEQQIGAVPAIVARAKDLDIKLSDMAVMLSEMVQAGGGNMTKDEAAELLFDNGGIQFYSQLTLPLATAAAVGPKRALGEAERGS